MARKPNIILIMSDQQRADSLGCMGNKIVETPNLDNLAKRGVVFENAHVQCPVCMASRAAIHTGRYPRTIRVPSMGVLPPTEVTLAEVLKRAGYATGMFGKLHFTPQGYTLRERGIDRPIHDAGFYLEPIGVDSAAMRAAVEDPYKKNYGFDVSEGIEDSQWGNYLEWLAARSPEHVPHHVSENWGAARDGIGFGASPPAMRMFQPHVSDFFDSNMPAELHPSSYVVERSLAFIEANRDGPFFVHCSFVDPHHPFNAPQPFSGKYPAADMPAPPPLDRDACYPQGLHEGIIRKIDRQIDFPTELWQWALANYYGMISNIDWCLGRLLKGLEDLSLTEETIIIFTSDHGEYVGDHRLLYKGSLLFDGLMRVPLIFSWGSHLRQGHRVPSMVQEIDIFPTALSLAELPVHEGVQGKSLSPLLSGGLEKLYDRVFCELDLLPDITYAPSQAIRREGWKLNYFPLSRTGMLFDLKNDPEERHNLFFDEGYRRTRDELMMDLLDQLFAQKDPLPIRLSQA
jgi:arylsulfatase A-like enzyme